MHNKKAELRSTDFVSPWAARECKGRGRTAPVGVEGGAPLGAVGLVVPPRLGVSAALRPDGPGCGCCGHWAF